MKHRLPLALFVLTLNLGAHPMGNFSVSHYARIERTAGGAAIQYVLDLAEIPSFELLQKWNLDAGSPREALERASSRQAREWVRNLAVTANGRAVTPRIVESGLVVDKGAGGMPVIRISAKVVLPPVAGKIEYEDRNYAERAGWKEIVIGSGPDRSQALTAYPQDPAVAPPQDLRVSLNWAGSAPVVSRKQPPQVVESARTAPVPTPPTAPGTVVRGDFLSRLLHSGEISFGMMLMGLAVAFGLGAMHALSPGHGKTIVAAYLVGTRGAYKHAIFLGGMVTFTHTISVFGLGLTTLFLSHYVLPEKVFPVLGAISGLSIVWIGAVLLYKRARSLHGHGDHHHHHYHDHEHDGHHHHHDHEHGHSHVPADEVTLGSLIALGASGGLVPCPSALVLLLSSIALGRIGLGLVLLVGFSVGLAIVLMGIGLIVLYAKHLLPESRKHASSPVFRIVPVVSAAFIVCVGLVMTGVSLGWIRPNRLLG